MKQKKDIKFIIAYAAFSLFSDMFLLTRLIDNYENSINYGQIFLMLGILTIIQLIFYFLLKKLEKKKVPLEKKYLVLAIIFGAVFLCAYLPAYIPDETTDFTRTLEITEGNLVSKKKKNVGIGNKLPNNISKFYAPIEKYSELADRMSIKMNKERTFYSFATKSLYAFTCYIPQVIGFLISKMLNLPIFGYLILGKICNYIVFVTMMYFAIKHIPFKKELVFFIALLPIVIQQTMSVSPDALTIGISIAFVAAILYFRNGTTKKITRGQLIMLALLAIMLSLCKIVYLPLCLLLFFIPEERFEKKKHKYVYTISLGIITTLINLYWLSISSQFLSAFLVRSDSSAQLAYILKNPISYIIILFRTIDVNIFYYLQTMIGGFLCLNDVPTPMILVIVALIILFYFIIKNDKKKFTFNLKEKLVIGSIITITLVLIFTSLYMQWTSVARSTVDGIQGRYFIPLLLPIAMLFMGEKKSDLEKQKYLVLFSIFFNITGLIAVITTFI